MRVVGYVRDATGPSESEPAFAQSERIRRWVNDAGHHLVAICQDVRTPGHPLDRDGFRAVLGIIGVGQVEALVVPDLTVLSPDKVLQEVMVWDVRRRGVTVLSTLAEDHDRLTDPPSEQIRLVVRDVLAKVSLHQELTGNDVPPGTVLSLGRAVGESDVIIELIAPRGDEGTADRPRQVSPGR